MVAQADGEAGVSKDTTFEHSVERMKSCALNTGHGGSGGTIRDAHENQCQRGKILYGGWMRMRADFCSGIHGLDASASHSFSPIS